MMASAHRELQRDRMRGKAGIVVGGGQSAGSTIGNGRATALLLARAGARVLVVDRDLPSARETVACIEQEGGVAAAHAADWTSPRACDDYVAACADLWGRIDFIQNNVGTLVGDAPADRVDPDSFERIWRINLAGCLYSSQAALRRMRLQGSGSIVNVSSVAAVAPAGVCAYSLSKAAMNGLTRELAAVAAADGVRVNTVMPGLLDTPMVMGPKQSETGLSLERLREERNRKVPLSGRMGTAWDTAFASLFLHSDEAAFITGAELRVDGGQSVLVGNLG